MSDHYNNFLNILLVFLSGASIGRGLADLWKTDQSTIGNVLYGVGLAFLSVPNLISIDGTAKSWLGSFGAAIMIAGAAFSYRYLRSKKMAT